MTFSDHQIVVRAGESQPKYLRDHCKRDNNKEYLGRKRGHISSRSLLNNTSEIKLLKGLPRFPNPKYTVTTVGKIRCLSTPTVQWDVIDDTEEEESKPQYHAFIVCPDVEISDDLATELSNQFKQPRYNKYHQPKPKPNYFR